MRKAFALILLLAVALSACSPQVVPAIQETSTAAATLPPSPTTAPDTATPSPVPASETPEPTETAEPTMTATPLPVDYGPDNFPKDVDPLTGLAVSNPASLDRRPVAIKVQLYPRGQRPVWGVSLADIVYEYYQNGGLSRLHVIFYGNNAKQAGPIRSARLLDTILVPMYGSVFAFGGADARILARLRNSSFGDRLIMEGTQNKAVLFRVEPNGPNYLFTNTEALSQHVTTIGINNDRQNLYGMTFQQEPPEGGEAGTEVSTRYSISAYNRFKYDPTTGRYLREQDTKEASTRQDEEYAPLIDGLTQEQIAVDNVVVLKVSTQDILPSKEAEIIEIKLNGTGQAYAFRDGKEYPVTWHAEQGKVLYLTGADGKAFPYKQGTTWYQVIGQNSTVDETQKADGAWRFEFKMP